MDLTTAVILLGCLLLGAAGGSVLTWAGVVPAARERVARLDAEARLLRERVTDLESAAAQDRELAATLSPLAGSLNRVQEQVATLERDRVSQYARLGEQLDAVRLSGEALRSQTAALAGALRSPTSRGAWGEVQLRRVVEHAGMLIRVDQMPAFLASLSPYLPTYHYAQLAWGAVGAASEDLLVSAAWLAGFAVVFFGVAAWAYRREARKFA